MGLGGAAADDAEAELMRRVCEMEVGGTGMLAVFEPLIVTVVTNPSKYPCPSLQASASLALAKFMLIRCVCECVVILYVCNVCACVRVCVCVCMYMYVRACVCVCGGASIVHPLERSIPTTCTPCTHMHTHTHTQCSDV